MMAAVCHQQTIKNYDDKFIGCFFAIEKQKIIKENFKKLSIWKHLVFKKSILMMKAIFSKINLWLFNDNNDNDDESEFNQ